MLGLLQLRQLVVSSHQYSASSASKVVATGTFDIVIDGVYGTDVR
jgi:hypothetical protein